MPFANLPPIGALYIPKYNNIPWSQPGGPGTTVFPQEAINAPMVTYPVPGQVISENSGIWVVGCGHYVMYPKIFLDFDNMLGSSVALVCCPICTFIQNKIYPAALVYDITQYPITII